MGMSSFSFLDLFWGEFSKKLNVNFKQNKTRFLITTTRKNSSSQFLVFKLALLCLVASRYNWDAMFEAYGNINNPDPAVTRILVLDSTSFLRAAVAD